MILTLLLLPFLANSQFSRRNRYRYEITGMLGATNFLGDLGGADQIGTHGFKDLNLVLTRPALGAGIRWRLFDYVTARVNLYWAVVRGDDKLTNEEFRHNRNLNFKSNIFELSGQIEGYFYSKEQGGHLYRIKGAKGFKARNMKGYGFAGIGAFYFNPKGEKNGTWYDLRPLHTEGEGILPGIKQYSQVSICIPLGIGFTYALDRYWSVGIEGGVRYTFTDYIDDCSTNYATDTLKKVYGANSLNTYFADPSLHDPKVTPVSGIEVTGQGQQRGDATHKDAYMFLTVTVGYKVFYRKRTRSKF